MECLNSITYRHGLLGHGEVGVDLLPDAVDLPSVLVLRLGLLLLPLAVGARGGTVLGRAPGAALLGHAAVAGGDVLSRPGLGRLRRHLGADWLDCGGYAPCGGLFSSDLRKFEKQPFYTLGREIRNWKLSLSQKCAKRTRGGWRILIGQIIEFGPMKEQRTKQRRRH